MANIQAPFGFTPFSNISGAGQNAQLTRRFANYNATAMFTGDPVLTQSDGTVAKSGTVAGVVSGIAVGFSWLSVSQGKQVWGRYWPGTDSAVGNYVEVLIQNDPSALYLVQVGGSASVGIVWADIGANAIFAYGTGNTLSGTSGAFLDLGTALATTATYPFRIVDIYTDSVIPPTTFGAYGTAQGAQTGPYNYVIVAMNNMDFHAGQTGVV